MIKIKYEVVLKLFKDYCMPKKNIVLERFLFNRCTQGDDKFENFLTKLKNLSTTCDFGNLADGMIRDRIVMGLRDSHTRERLLRVENITLEKATEMCRAAELAKHHMQLLDVDPTEQTTSSTLSADSVSRKTQKYSKTPRQSSVACGTSKPEGATGAVKKCGKCGYIHRWGRCPAQGKRCKKCLKLDHFAQCCYTRNVDDISNEDEIEVASNVNETNPLYFDYVSINNVTGQGSYRDWYCPLVFFRITGYNSIEN